MIPYVVFGIALAIGLPIAALALLRLGIVVYVGRSYRRMMRKIEDGPEAFRQFADASYNMSMAIADREDLNPDWFTIFRSVESLMNDEHHAPSQAMRRQLPVIFYGAWWVMLAIWANKPLDRRASHSVARILLHCFGPAPVKAWARARALRHYEAAMDRTAPRLSYHFLSYTDAAPRIERRAERTIEEYGELMRMSTR